MKKGQEGTDWACVLAALIISLGALAAYRNCLSGAFVYDDTSAIADNLTIRHLWPIWPVLHPPQDGSPVSGRPLANLSFAVNYAFGEGRVWGYHALNLAIHILAGLTLYGILRRTLALVSTRYQVEMRSTWVSHPYLIALATAVIWTVHPLQTESVTYIVGRTESLAGLFYLLTMYCFIRGIDFQDALAGERKNRPLDEPIRRAGLAISSFLWHFLAVFACLAGMATKEVMATAPLMVLLYDRTFVAGSFQVAWRRRQFFYVSLGCTWLLLAYLVAGARGRGGTVGFDLGVPWWSYALTQFRAIAHYLRLSVWPYPLVIDYGRTPGGPIPVVDGLIVGTLVMATVVAIWRKLPLGFLGAWFFVILAPSSSVVPVVTEYIAEHRIYLPLAAVVLLATMGLHKALGKRSWMAFVGLTAILIAVSARRNQDYRSAQTLWGDTVEKVPDNAGAHNNFGKALLVGGNLSGAIQQFTMALRIDPRLAGAWSNLGAALLRDGRVEEAILNDREALRLAPGYGGGHINLGIALTRADRLPEAIAEYEAALRLDSDRYDIHYMLGNILVQSGRLPEAISHFEAALRLKPDYAEAQSNLGGALLETGHIAEAIACYEAALRLKPDLIEAQVNLGSALLKTGRPEEAIAKYETALSLRPDYSVAHYDLGVALRSLGRNEEARIQFDMAKRGGK